MALRWYLPTQTTPAAVTPLNHSRWTAIANSETAGANAPVKAVHQKTSTAFATIMRAETGATNTLNRHYLVATIVSDPLNAQTIGGAGVTFYGQMIMREAATQANCVPQVVLYVVSRDGQTIRGTLYGGDTRTDATDEMNPTTLTHIKNPPAALSPVTTTAVTCQQGDRLVIQFGHRLSNTVTTNYNISYRLGDNAATDIPIGSTAATDLNPWFELSSDPVFEPITTIYPSKVGNITGLTAVAPPADATLASQPYRTILPASEWTEVMTNSASTPASTWWNMATYGIIAVADRYVNVDTTPQNLVAVGSGSSRFRDSAKEIEIRLHALALAHRKTGTAAYFTRALAEMNNCANMSNWTGGEFLDTATILSGMGMAYDWFYSQLSSAERTTMKIAIYNKGLVPAKNAFINGDHWTNSFDTNWVFVCNSAVAIAGLAIYDHNPSSIDDLLSKCKTAIEGGLSQFTPEGAWAEGPGMYLAYGFDRLGRYIATLESAYGTTENSGTGLWVKPGIYDVGKALIHSADPLENGLNIGDSDSKPGFNDLIYRLSVKANRPEYTVRNLYWQSMAGNAPDAFAPVYFRPSMNTGTGPVSAGYPLEDGFTGKGALICMRESWTGSDAAWVGMGMTTNESGHAHMDIGGILLTAEGLRWFVDIGSEAYTLANYFTEEVEDAGRWTYYRTRTEGHNTLVLNASSHGGQKRIGGVGTIDLVRSDASQGVGIGNLSTAYTHAATSVKRGIKTISDRSQFVVQDEITGLISPGMIHWFAHYNQAAGITATWPYNGSSAEVMLTHTNGKRLYCKILSPSGAVFNAAAANATPMTQYGSPSPAGMATNTSFKKLKIELTGRTGATTLTVFMAPLAVGESVPTAPAVTALSAW